MKSSTVLWLIVATLAVWAYLDALVNAGAITMTGGGRYKVTRPGEPGFAEIPWIENTDTVVGYIDLTFQYDDEGDILGGHGRIGPDYTGGGFTTFPAFSEPGNVDSWTRPTGYIDIATGDFEMSGLAELWEYTAGTTDGPFQLMGNIYDASMMAVWRAPGDFYSKAVDVSNATVTFVPEPSAAFLWALGCILIIGRLR